MRRGQLWKKKRKTSRDTYISLRIICWHIEVGDDHICYFNNSNIKPLVLFLYNWLHWGWLRALLLLKK